MRMLIIRAREIIREEFENVYEDFREEDGSISEENHRQAMRLQTRMGNWLDSADKLLANGPAQKGSRFPTKPKHKIVVQK